MNGKRSPLAKSSSSGFTLIELAIAVVIGSFMIVAGIALYRTWWAQSQLTANQARMSAIQQALANYMSQHNRLPCPSSYIAAPGVAIFGREISYPATTGCTAAPADGVNTFSATGRSGNKIRIGAVPVRDLGLPDSDRTDVYGYLFTYAVTEALTPAPCPTCSPVVPPLDTSLASIEVVDQKGNDVLPAAIPPQTGAGTAMYVLVDHGKDGKGAYYNGVATTAKACGSTAGLDNDNCNHYASGFFRTASFSQVKGPTTWFDDTVVYGTGLANTNTASACTTRYSDTATPGSPAYGTSWGHYYNGSDNGFFVGGGFIFFYAFIFYDVFNIYSQPVNYTGQGPIVDAYCPDASYNVVAGGCTQTRGIPTKAANGSVTDPYGLDINISASGSAAAPVPILPGGVNAMISIPLVNVNYSQIALPPYSHPAIPNAGLQGWECNGSSSGNQFNPGVSMHTQAYAVCCPSNGG